MIEAVVGSGKTVLAEAVRWADRCCSRTSSGGDTGVPVPRLVSPAVGQPTPLARGPGQPSTGFHRLDTGRGGGGWPDRAAPAGVGDDPLAAICGPLLGASEAQADAVPRASVPAKAKRAAPPKALPNLPAAASKGLPWPPREPAADDTAPPEAEEAQPEEAEVKDFTLDDADGPDPACARGATRA